MNRVDELLFKYARLSDMIGIKACIRNAGGVNIQDDSGNTPLHLACYYDCLEVVQVLLRNGADVNIQDEDGDTPLHLISSYDDLDIVKLLKEGAK